MSRVLTFSPVFPSYHPKAGQPTYFVEKIYLSFADIKKTVPAQLVEYFNAYFRGLKENESLESMRQYLHSEPKYHTIRAGHRWKVGDKFSPRVWSGKAYRSKQVIIGPDIEVKKTWQFIIHKDKYRLSGHGKTEWIDMPLLEKIAGNDGLSVDDLELWFAPYGKNDPEECQIICWNDKIEY